MLDFLGFGPATLRGRWGVKLSGALVPLRKNFQNGSGGARWVWGGRKGFPAAQPRPRGPSPAQTKILPAPKRTGQVLRVGNVIWVPPRHCAIRRNKGFGRTIVGRLSRIPVPVTRLWFGNFSTHCPGMPSLRGRHHRWCQTPGFCGVPETAIARPVSPGPNPHPL